MAALLFKLKGETGRTVVAATHDLNLASLLGDRLLALSGGRALAVGSPAEILRPELLATSSAPASRSSVAASGR